MDLRQSLVLSSIRHLRRPAVYSLAGLLSILIAVFILHLPTLDDHFHGDDYVAFTEFRTTSFGEYAKSVFFFEDANFYWRPLGKLFHRALFEVTGLDPLAFRLAALGVFLGTIGAIYAFCVRERLGYAVALGAAGCFAFVPNHVVSVAWVTNTSRLLSLLFFVCCLLALQGERRKIRIGREVLAWSLFGAAVLSDETVLALAPVVVYYATFVAHERVHWRPALLRLGAFALLVVLLVPLQLANTLDDEPRLAYYGIGPHVVTQTWALASQLVLPLAEPATADTLIASITTVQWAAGLAAVLIGSFLVVVGSARMRFLLLWAAFGLAPFALWDVLYTSPRYVYVAAAPYAICVSWMCVSMVRSVIEVVGAGRLRLVGLSAGMAGIAALLLLGVMTSANATRERNEAWGRNAAYYEILAKGLEAARDRDPEVSRIVLAGPWPQFWASAVAQTVYGDESIQVRVIRGARAELGTIRLQKEDAAFYVEDEQLISLAVPQRQ
jgi:hypothetical protein